MATNLPSRVSIQCLEQLLKFLVNFTLLKYVKSQRSYGSLLGCDFVTSLITQGKIGRVHIFVINNNESFISQILSLTGPLGRKFNFLFSWDLKYKKKYKSVTSDCKNHTINFPLIHGFKMMYNLSFSSLWSTFLGAEGGKVHFLKQPYSIFKNPRN